MACAELPKDSDDKVLAIRYLREDTLVSKLLLNVEYRPPGVPPAVSLVTEGQDEDVIKNLIRDGWLQVSNRRERRLQKLVSLFLNLFKGTIN